MVSRINFSFRSCIPLSIPLLRACSPEDSEHTDLPLPAPSSTFPWQSLQCAQSKNFAVSNCKHRSRSLPDLTGHLTARADGGHALPLGSSGKPFRLTFILPSPLVRSEERRVGKSVDLGGRRIIKKKKKKKERERV